MVVSIHYSRDIIREEPAMLFHYWRRLESRTPKPEGGAAVYSSGLTVGVPKREIRYYFWVIYPMASHPLPASIPQSQSHSLERRDGAGDTEHGQRADVIRRFVSINPSTTSWTLFVSGLQMLQMLQRWSWNEGENLELFPFKDVLSGLLFVVDINNTVQCSAARAGVLLWFL